MANNIEQLINERRMNTAYKITIQLCKYEYNKALEWAKEVTGHQSISNCGMNYRYEEELFKNLLGKLGECAVVYASIGEGIELKEINKLYTDIPTKKNGDFTYDFKNRFNKTIDVKTISNVTYNLCDNLRAIKRKGNDIYILVRTMKDFKNGYQLEQELIINGYIEFVIEGIAVKDELLNGEVKYSSGKSDELRILKIEELHDFMLINSIGGDSID